MSRASDTAASVIKDVQATIKPLKAISKAASAALKAAGADLFTAVSSFGSAVNGIVDHIETTSATPFTLNLSGIKTSLAKAPAEFTKGASDVPVVLALPMPDGTLARFKIVRSEVMDPALARQFPSIRTYRGIGIDDPTADVRLDTTPAGFHAQVLTTQGAIYIDPYHLNDANGTYVSYYQADAVENAAWTCAFDSSDVEDEQTALEVAQADHSLEVPSITYGGTLKTYRAAVAGNRPYVTAATTGMAGGATTANGQAQIVTAMNRVTGVYETELSIRLTLVATNSTVVYGTDNPLADPYSNSTNAINQNTSNLNTRVGSANYDIGHVFTTGSGGVAQLGCVGGSNKGAGTTGTSSPVGDPFTIDYVAHEMGHQFGANHTFNTSQDSNRSAGHAYEPGSGLSIMGYAGIEATEDLAGHSIAYFHSDSVDAIRTFVTNSIPSVGVASSNGDTAPSVNAGSDYVIPAQTPFALTATGSDADGDTLTYDWQERDLGAAVLLTTADNGASPLFTEITPTNSPTRTLPRLNSVLTGFLNTLAGGTGASAANVLGSGSNTVGARLAERMYAAARTSTWRVTARDNRGGLSTDDKVLSVVNTGAAFAITSYGAVTSIPGGSTPTLAWNVAGTTGSGINVANVKISLSTDGGQTFPIVLAASTPNDGSETIQIPYALGTSTARIKVEAIGNIFFDINNANLTITNVAVPGSATPGAPLLAAASDTGVSSSDGITKNDNSSAAAALTFSVPGTVAGALVELLADGVVVGSATASGTTTSITTNGAATLTDGSRVFTARQTEVSKPVSAASASTSVVVDGTAPLAPAIPDLLAGSDSGVSDSDDITNVTNPSFGVSSSDSYYQLSVDGSQVSGDYATGSTVAQTLAEGGHDLSLRSVDAAGNVSSAGPTLHVVIDTVAPTLTTPATFQFETAQSVLYTFSEALGGTLGDDDINITSATATVPAYTVAFDGLGTTATISFASLLPDGDYTATLSPPAGTVTDVAGNSLAATDPLNFFFLAGDANRDRKVDFNDLVLLAQNYNQSGHVFSEANLNYSADGLIDFNDLVILAQQYGKSLDAPRALIPFPGLGAVSTTAVPTKSGRKTVGGDILG